MDPSDQLPFVDIATHDAVATEEAVLTDGLDGVEAIENAEPGTASEDLPAAGPAVGPSDAPTGTPAAPVPPAPPARAFQASAGIQGRQFAEQCDTLLGGLGYELRGRRVLAEVGVEIDQEAVSPSGVVVWFEYKGSVQGHRPGLRRTDTLKKAIANGALLRALPDPAPYVVITSHLPEAGSGAAMLEAALRLTYMADVVCLYDPKATQRLRRW